VSAFDPFGDFETRGYLQNHAGVKDPDIVKRLEHNAFSRNVQKALVNLREASEVDLERIRETHRTLFSDVYPWAGLDRSQNAAQLAITKGEIEFQLAPFVPQGVAHALKNDSDHAAFRSDPGKIIGELAYAHPFLDGNGRTITVVVSELARRAGFHIAWENTDKTGYLKALTDELNDPDKGHLTRYLKPHVREGERSVERIASTLNTLPGLSAPDQAQESTPVLTIVAGPNGAGKSTLTASGAFGDRPVIDPDAIARTLNPDNPSAAVTRAGKRALELRRQMLAKGQSFVVETTLSGMSTLSLMKEAQEAGFRTELKFIGLSSSELSKARVAGRVAAGGHDVPQEDIERRFSRSLDSLPTAISKADRVELYENSGKDPHRLVADLAKDHSRFLKAPKWATDAAFEAAQNDLTKATTVDELKYAANHALMVAKAAGVTDDQIQREIKNLARVQDRKKAHEGHDL